MTQINQKWTYIDLHYNNVNYLPIDCSEVLYNYCYGVNYWLFFIVNDLLRCRLELLLTSIVKWVQRYN